MSVNAETNVRIAPCTLDALRRITARRGTSRDETVRQLLAEHVTAQEQRHPEDRLTHISTVLRYPPPPRWRGDARKDVPLRVRAPHGLLERARAVSLRLPGQHPRAYRDYQGRMLTDAVTTAIAAAESFTDDFITGLLPLLRHGAALGLWRLTVAATSTGPEKAWLVEAEAVRADLYLSNAPLTPDQEYALRVAEILERDEAWHAADRFRQATGLARDYLTGHDARHWEQVLYDQAEAFNEDYQDRLQADDSEERRWRRRHGITSYDFTGRGGTAVWRAQRRANLEYFEEWLVKRTKGDPAAGVMASPGWLLRTPPTWLAHAPAQAAGQPPEPFSAWAANSRLLAFPYLSRQAFWPLLPTPGLGWQPVPGFEPVAAAAATLRPDQVLGFIEALLIDWNHTFAEEPSLRIALDLPADKARRFDFITAKEQHRIMAEARAITLENMDRFIDRVADTGASEIYLQKLKEARGNAREFHRLSLQYNKHKRPTFGVGRATWRWPGRTVAAELVTGAPPNLLQWLAAAAHRHSTLLLEKAMQEAWQCAFDQYGFRM
ncbi:hypothetical protein [Streptomyces angustmyceticus]|uniref:hypothetical protein n=1 Tax=Streptomyces angustmyceticus TaxID=285578 RepID=UPI0021AF8DF6|nr:hypothetical protein [Streptomyces angustmyceticus]